MKKAAKLISLLLVLVMVLGMSACGAKGDIEISFIVCEYSDNTQEYMEKIISDFEAAHEGVKVNLEMVSWDDATTTIQSRVGSGQAPDILNLDSYSQYLEDNLLLPAEDYVSDDLMNTFYQTFYDYNVATDGVVYAVPFVASVRNLYYSKAIFEECGIAEAPATWDDVLDVCQVILDKYNGEVYPWGMDFTTNEGQANFSYFIWNFGGGWVDENNNWTLNCPENVEALQFMLDMYNNGLTNANPLTDDRDSMQAMMNNGKIAMMISANFFPALYPDLDLGVAPIPSNGEQESIQLGVQDRLMVFDNDYSEEKLEAIKQFVEYMFTCDDYADWCLTEGLLPVTQECFDYLITQNEVYQVYKDALASVKFYPSYLPDWGDARVGAIEAVQSCATGSMTPQDALDALQAKIAG